MNTILEMVNDQITFLEKKKKKIQKDFDVLPKTTLKVNHDKYGNPRYYEVISNGRSPRQEKYLSKKKTPDYIQALAKNDYYKHLLPIISKELDVLNNFKSNYSPEKKNNCLSNCSSLKNPLIENIFPTPAEIATKFEEWQYEPNPYRPEQLIYESDRGEMVRSKSEGFIANFLLQNNDRWAYKYEAPFQLKNGTVIYPDFTIVSRITGNKYYLEHCGIFDDMEYVNNFIWKHNQYIQNDIIPGQQLLYTYETGDNPLNIGNMKKLLRIALK